MDNFDAELSMAVAIDTDKVQECEKTPVIDAVSLDWYEARRQAYANAAASRGETLMSEAAPNAPGAEEWIQKHKEEFKKKYGQNWAHVLYGKAWHIFGDKATNGPKHESSHVTVVKREPDVNGHEHISSVTQQTFATGFQNVQQDDVDLAILQDDDFDEHDEFETVAESERQLQHLQPLNEKAVTSFVPPAAVQKAARQGLELRSKHGRGGWDSRQAHSAGIGSGVVRAQTLASGKGISIDTVRRMRSFFARHDGERERNARKRDETSAANIAWLLWGGDPGRSWVNELLAKD